MTERRTPALGCLLAVVVSALVWAAAWCSLPGPKPVETTPTVVVVQPTPAPTLQTVIAGPPHPRHTPTPAWTPDPVLVRPTSTPLPPTATPQPTDTPEPPTLTPVRTMQQKG